MYFLVWTTSWQRWAAALFCTREREAKKERESAKKKEHEKKRKRHARKKERERDGRCLTWLHQFWALCLGSSSPHTQTRSFMELSHAWWINNTNIYVF
jgi:hypothetical protein